MFYGNTVADDQGGAMTLNIGGPLTIRNCTIVANTAGRACGALWFGNPALPITITNSIVAYNAASQDHGQDQVGYQPIDGGGTIEYPAPLGSGRKVAQGGRVVEPILDSLTQENGMLALPLKAGSPAVDSAVAAGAPADDICRNRRDSRPDVGAWEYHGHTAAVACL